MEASVLPSSDTAERLELCLISCTGGDSAVPLLLPLLLGSEGAEEEEEEEEGIAPRLLDCAWLLLDLICGQEEEEEEMAPLSGVG